MNLSARLLEDGGAAASGPDFFRSPEFLTAEETTHSLLIEGPDRSTLAAAPLLVRPIPGSARHDAISPYGYPGLAPTTEAADRSRAPAAGITFPLDPGTIDFSDTGLVTIFIRHALGHEIPLANATPRNLCLLSDPSLPRKSRMSDRQQIRKNLKRGYTLEIVPGADADEEQRAGFFTAYTETMRRTAAAKRYFFPREYFDTILAADGTWLVLAREGEGRIAAASIAARSDGLIHYYLSGTADSNLRDSPMKNVVEEMIGFAAGMNLPVSFGGGLTPGDALETFKRGFANREERWFTSEIVSDPAVATELATARKTRTGTEPEPGFFPAYRAPA